MANPFRSLNTRFHVWLVNLLRAALNDRFDAIDARLALIESHFASIAVRVKEKQEEAKKHLPNLGQQWGARRRALERQAENNG